MGSRQATRQGDLQGDDAMTAKGRAWWPQCRTLTRLQQRQPARGLEHMGEGKGKREVEGPEPHGRQRGDVSPQRTEATALFRLDPLLNEVSALLCHKTWASVFPTALNDLRSFLKLYGKCRLMDGVCRLQCSQLIHPVGTVYKQVSPTGFSLDPQKAEGLCSLAHRPPSIQSHRGTAHQPRALSWPQSKTDPLPGMLSLKTEPCVGRRDT